METGRLAFGISSVAANMTLKTRILYLRNIASAFAFSYVKDGGDEILSFRLWTDQIMQCRASWRLLGMKLRLLRIFYHHLRIMKDSCQDQITHEYSRQLEMP